MGLEAGIWVSRLKAGGGKKEEKEKEEEKEEKFLLCESIGHRPLRGRCPKSKNSTRLIINPVKIQNIETRNSAKYD